MGQGFSHQPQGYDALKAKIRELERRIDTLATAGNINNSAISPGGQLVVLDASGTELMVVGDLGARAAKKMDGTDQQGWIFRRDSGEPVGSALTNVVGGLQSWNWTNRLGDGIVSDDAFSGDALATPWLPLGAMMPLSTTAWQSTTSASYSDMYGLQTYRQHPEAILFGWVFAPTSTNGDIRVLCNGTQIGSAVSIVGNSAAIQSWQIGPAVTSTGWHSTLDIRVQARRTAGTGSFALVPLLTLGVQSF